ncbi:asparagine synthetase B family protein [Nitrococcus mobilis]|uniref:asparagine synthase (glutamine-hydrolyzing) n=1 Tax=Nitrococcus mobilis Nb-231 TaxID=314278 RepID=A4BT66_9GAMM|nr:asparagine synthase-related protein [Nitrococcus mobilis]EAR21134.1 Asparagine synthase, glutamine-hydrolyzing [Nitrococcus mobilis Nb-231]
MMPEVWGQFGGATGSDGALAPQWLAAAADRSVAIGAYGLAAAGAGTFWLEREDFAVAGVGRVRCGGSDGYSATEELESFLAAFRRSGYLACRDLRGSYALLLLDRRSGTGLALVDRLGTWPLYYTETAGGLLVATALGKLTAHSAAKAGPDPQAILNYLYFHVVPSPRTIYREMHRLQPGQGLRFDAHGGSIWNYWRPQYTEDPNLSWSETRAEFRNRLYTGVERSLDGRPIGAFLSGGTDSSTVTGMLREVTGERPRTFSIGFDAEGYDETGYAQTAARHFDADHQQYYVTPADVVAAIPIIAAGYDQPFGNASVIPAYYCAKLARQSGIDILLGGDGGDELFGGNARYAKQWVFTLPEHLPRGVQRHLLWPLGHRLPAWPGVRKLRSYLQQAQLPMPERLESYNLLIRIGLDRILQPDFLAELDTGRPLEMIREVYWSAQAQSMVNRMLARDLKFTLADDDLVKVRGACALAGVDTAFPLLDDDIVALSLRLPAAWKVSRTKLRPFFKAALQDFLPRAVIGKQKHGFGLPFGIWLTQQPALRELAGDSLETLRSRAIVRPQFLDELMSHRLHAYPAYYGTLVWTLMMLEQWFQTRERGSKRGGMSVASGAS